MKRNYLSPKTTVCEVELESSICDASVFTPDKKQELTIEKQDFNDTWDTNADFSGESTGWTPNSSN